MSDLNYGKIMAYVIIGSGSFLTVLLVLVIACNYKLRQEYDLMRRMEERKPKDRRGAIPISIVADPTNQLTGEESTAAAEHFYKQTSLRRRDNSSGDQNGSQEEPSPSPIGPMSFKKLMLVVDQEDSPKITVQEHPVEAEINKDAELDGKTRLLDVALENTNEASHSQVEEIPPVVDNIPVEYNVTDENDKAEVKTEDIPKEMENSSVEDIQPVTVQDDQFNPEPTQTVDSTDHVDESDSSDHQDEKSAHVTFQETVIEIEASVEHDPSQYSSEDVHGASASSHQRKHHTYQI